MKFIFILAVLLFLSSCSTLWNANNYEKCKDKCYEQYQIAVKPCQNSLYGEECKEPLEKIYQDCLKQCRIQYAEAERSSKQDRKENMKEYFGQ